MRIRTRLVAAVLTAGALTAVGTLPALADPTAIAVEEKGAVSTKGAVEDKGGEPGDSAKPGQGKPEGEAKPGKGRPGEVKPGEGQPGEVKPGKGQPEVPEEAVALLAKKLDISVERSRQVFRDLEKVKARGDEILVDRAFVAIADGLGLTPQQLLDVLREVKEAIGGQPKPKPVDSGSPTK